MKEYVNLDQDLERILPTHQTHHPYPSSPIITSANGVLPGSILRLNRDRDEGDVEQPSLVADLEAPLLGSR